MEMYAVLHQAELFAPEDPTMAGQNRSGPQGLCSVVDLRLPGFRAELIVCLAFCPFILRILLDYGHLVDEFELAVG
jgi:hypothetical protein